MMTKGSLRIKPGIAHLTFHQAIDPHAFENREQLAQSVRAAILSGLPKRMWGDEDLEDSAPKQGAAYKPGA